MSVKLSWTLSNGSRKGKRATYDEPMWGMIACIDVTVCCLLGWLCIVVKPCEVADAPGAKARENRDRMLCRSSSPHCI